MRLNASHDGDGSVPADDGMTQRETVCNYGTTEQASENTVSVQ